MTETRSFSGLGLKGRVILITGAGRGLGRAYARAIAKAGAAVVVHDAGVDENGQNPDPTCAARVVDDLKSGGHPALSLTELLEDFRSCATVVARARDWMGRLDGIIHNAGSVIWRDPSEVHETLYRRMMGVASEAAFGLCAAALPAMRAQGYGRLVFTSSGWAFRPSDGSDELVLYAQGKAAQVGLAMALARGAGNSGIRTNVIVPVAKTRIFKGAVPPGCLKPEAVAGAVAWLVSPACNLTGVLVEAKDGQLSLLRMQTLDTRHLGDKASDPIAAGAAILEMAAAAGLAPSDA